MSPQRILTLPDEKYVALKRALIESTWFFEEERTLFALGLGSNRASVFDAISRNPQIEIVWRGSYLPWWARPFGVLAAAYGGIVKVSGRDGLEVACDNLLSQAAMELLVVSKSAEGSIAARLRTLGRKASALSLAAEEADGVIGAIFIDDDTQGEYPVVYHQSATTDFPFLREYEQSA